MIWPLLLYSAYYLETRIDPRRRQGPKGFIGYAYEEALDPATAKGWQPLSIMFGGKAKREELPQASPLECLFSLYHNRLGAWSFSFLQLLKMFILFSIFGAGMLGAAAELGIAIALSAVMIVFLVVVRPFVSNLQNLAEVVASLCELLVYILFIVSSLQSGEQTLGSACTPPGLARWHSIPPGTVIPAGMVWRLRADRN
jgi:hypothetical protein